MSEEETTDEMDKKVLDWLDQEIVAEKRKDVRFWIELVKETFQGEVDAWDSCRDTLRTAITVLKEREAFWQKKLKEKQKA